MRPPIALLTFIVTSPLFAQTDKPLLHEREVPVVAEPSFRMPLAEPFVASKGKWVPEAGELRIVDIPEEKHIPVLHHRVGLASATIECEFRLGGTGSFLVGCDGEKHIGRVVVNVSGLSIAEDSVKPSRTLAKLPMAVKPGIWHNLRVEWRGDQMAARLDGKELRAQHAYLATTKLRSWLAANETVRVRKLKIRGEANQAKP